VLIASRASRASAPPHIEPLVLRALGPDSDRVEVEGDVLKCLRLDIQHD